MAKHLRFKLRVSDRSGFQYLERELVKDGASRVGPDEHDDPPPSKLSLGGEGDINRGDYFRSTTSTLIDSDKDNPTNFITANGGITPSYSHPWMRVVGSGSNILAITPAIKIGAGDYAGRQLTLEGVGSSITLESGGGLSMVYPCVLGSGSIITFIWAKTA